jgi:hypothetical protein
MPTALAAPPRLSDGSSQHRLVGTAPVGIAALEAATACPEADTLEHLGRLADRIAAKLEAAHFMQANARAIAELQRLYTEQRQMQETILEPSAPLLPLLQGVLVLPLVGAIDTLRAQHMLEAELEAITIHRATVMLVDITGVADRRHQRGAAAHSCGRCC